MSDLNGLSPDLTPEQREAERHAMAKFQRRIRDGIFSAQPAIREKMDSMAPGVRITSGTNEEPIPWDREEQTERD